MMTKNQKELNAAVTTTFYILASQDKFAISYRLGRLHEIRRRVKIEQCVSTLSLIPLSSATAFCNGKVSTASKKKPKRLQSGASANERLYGLELVCLVLSDK